MIERPWKGKPLVATLVLALSPMTGMACGSGVAGGGRASGESDASGQSTGGSGGGGQAVSSAGGSGSGGQAVAAMGGSGGGVAGGSGGEGTSGGAGSSGAGSSGGVADIDAGSGGATDIDAGGSGADGTDGEVAISDAPATGATAPEHFVCSQVMGLMLTDQWYTAGFETAPGIDDARWQLKWMDHSYIDEWANPNSAFWAIVPASPCAQDSDNPDRVLLVALSWTLVTLADWEMNVQEDVDNIKAKYSNVKQIVLMTIVRGPNNVSCGNTTVVAENTLIPSYVDQALADVAAATPNLVKVAPKFAASSCADFMGTGPHLTAAGDAEIAQMVAATYANQ